MAGPGGREVERISVKVVPDTSGFAAKLRAFLEGQEKKQELEIPVEFDEKFFQSQLKKLVKKTKASIDVELDKKALRKIPKQVKEVASGLSVGLEGFISPSSLRKINKDIENFGKQTEVTFTAKMDKFGLKKDLNDFFDKTHVTIQAELEKAAVLGDLRELRGLMDRTHVSFNAELETAAVKEKLVELTRPRDLKLRLNASVDNHILQKLLAKRHIDIHTRSNIGQVVTAMGRAFNAMKDIAVSVGKTISGVLGGIVKLLIGAGGSVLSGLKGIGKAMPVVASIFHVAGTLIQVAFFAVIIPAIFAAVQALLAMAAAVTLALAPAVFIAAGIAIAQMIDKGSKASERFKKNIEALGKTARETLLSAVEPMLKALNEQIPEIRSYIKYLEGPLKRAFTAASKYVDELAGAVQGFIDGALSGLIVALQSPGMQNVMDGFQEMMERIGLAIGNFFAILATFGPDMEKTLIAIGKAFQTLSGPFARMLGAFSKLAPGTIEKIANGLAKVMDTLARPGVQRAIQSLASLSFDIIFEGIVWLLQKLEELWIWWEDVRKKAGSTEKAIEQIWNKFKTWWAKKWEEIKEAASTALAEILKDAILKFLGIKGASDALEKFMDGVWKAIKNAANRAWSALKAWATRKLNEMKSSASGVIEDIKGFFRSLGATASGIISDITFGLVNLQSTGEKTGSILGSLGAKMAAGLDGPIDSLTFDARVNPVGFGALGGLDSQAASWRTETRRIMAEGRRQIEVPALAGGDTYNFGDVLSTTETTPKAIVNALKRVDALHGN